MNYCPWKNCRQQCIWHTCSRATCYSSHCLNWWYTWQYILNMVANNQKQDFCNAQLDHHKNNWRVSRHVHRNDHERCNIHLLQEFHQTQFLIYGLLHEQAELERRGTSCTSSNSKTISASTPSERTSWATLFLRGGPAWHQLQGTANDSGEYRLGRHRSTAAVCESTEQILS